ncbi:hydrocephalus-inducing protein homolog [Agelaius phoeniceus]|uniref:hydrocephalus-inducing protein homolog n=1 Tax=Agelaius phoeniceus TaxID=39638 RepID=UPI004054AF28
MLLEMRQVFDFPKVKVQFQLQCQGDGGHPREMPVSVLTSPSDVLTLQYQPLSLKNTCLLPLDLMLDLEQPFLVCDKKLQPLPGGQPLRVDVGKELHLYVAFDPAYELDFKSWRKQKVLKIDMVRGHPFVERISLEGEVHFPNLKMEPSSVEFGFIRPDTEEVRSLEMTNCSPLPVQYRWSFRSDSEVTRFRYVHLCPPLEALLAVSCLYLAKSKAVCLASDKWH